MRSSPVSWRTSACSSRGSRAATACTPSRISTLRRRAASWRASGSRRDISASSEQPPTARPTCSRRSSHPRSARGTPSGVGKELRTCRRSASWRRTSRSASSGATCAASSRRFRRVDLTTKIRDVPDWPQPGIIFKDIMPLLADPDGLRQTVDELAEWAGSKKPDVILAVEARGYITGGALALKLGCGFAAARKPGKLPWKTVQAKYALEYGEDTLELHEDAISNGQRVLIHDDVLATGGTAKATVELVEQLGGEVVGLPFIIELTFLNGREKLADYDVHALITY